MTAQIFNNTFDTLSNAVDNVQTSFDVSSGDIPSIAAGDYIPIHVIRASDNAFEIMHVTGVSGTTLTVDRATEAPGDSPLTFNSGDRVEVRPTRQSLAEADASSSTVTTSTGTQTLAGALDDRATSDNLSAPSGASLVGYENGLSVEDAIKDSRSKNVSISHRREAGYIYDVINVSGGTDSIIKKYGDDVDASGVQTRLTPKQLAKQKGAVAAVNCDFFSAPDGSDWSTDPQGKNWGLQIVDGIAYRDWDANAIDVALVMMKSGDIEIARKTDGKTAQQWVDDGAVWCVSGRGLAVENGVTQDISSYPGNDVVSARNVFGIDADGNFIFVLVEGVSNSYGATANQAGQLAFDEGAVLAISLDGGGSAQCWWDDCYAMPSTDSSPRGVVGCLMINSPAVPTYDTGGIEITPGAIVTGADDTNFPEIYLRQVGSSVRLSLNATTGTLTQDVFEIISTDIKTRFISENIRTTKGFVDTGSDFGKCIVTTTDISVRSFLTSGNRVLGNMTWESRYSDE